jgi:hypothetical protein
MMEWSHLNNHFINNKKRKVLIFIIQQTTDLNQETLKKIIIIKI